MENMFSGYVSKNQMQRAGKLEIIEISILHTLRENKITENRIRSGFKSTVPSSGEKYHTRCAECKVSFCSENVYFVHNEMRSSHVIS